MSVIEVTDYLRTQHGGHMKVVLTRKIHHKAEALFSENGFSCEVWENQLPPTKEQLKELCSEASGILSMLSDKIDIELINHCPKLKVISNYAVGYNNIDTNYCLKKGINVGHTPDVLTDATAELAMALTLSVTRNITLSHNQTKDGKWKTWEPMGYLGMSLENKTLGIFGMGRIGFSYAKKMHKAFGMKVLYTNRNPRPEYENEIGAISVSLDELLKKSDVLSLHSPLTDETRELFDKNKLSKMKKGSYFINTSRGELVVQKDLEDALKTNLRGAGLDVTTPEPLPLESPLHLLPNLVLAPHIGSATDEAREHVAELAALNIINALQHKEMPAKVC